MDRQLLGDRLKAWGKETEDSLVIACGALLGAGKTPPRPILEAVRDRLDRAQERYANSRDAEQKELAAMVAGLDEIRHQLPTN